MSLRDNLSQATSEFRQREQERQYFRENLKDQRNEEDHDLGAKHGLEDIDAIVEALKQRAARGFLDLEMDIEKTNFSWISPYAQGYYESVNNYMRDNDVGVFVQSRQSVLTEYVQFLRLYWR